MNRHPEHLELFVNICSIWPPTRNMGNLDCGQSVKRLIDLFGLFHAARNHLVTFKSKSIVYFFGFMEIIYILVL